MSAIPPPQQLEFERLLASVRGAELPRRQRRRMARVKPEEFPTILNRALLSENVAFHTFALMIAIHTGGGRVSRAKLSLDTGSSYQAICHQTRRTPWFSDDHSGPLVAVKLNPDGVAKLERITRKLSDGY